MPDSQFYKPKQKKTTKRDEFDFFNFIRHYWLGLRRFFVFLITTAVIISVGVFAYCKVTYVPRYRCSVTFLATPLVPSADSGEAAIYRYSNRDGLGSQLSTTFPTIFTSGILRDVVANELGGNIDGSISAIATPETNYFEVSVISGNPESAKNIADSLIKNYPRVAENVLGDIKAEIKIPAKTPTKPYNRNEYLKWMMLSFGGTIVLGMVLIGVYVVRRKTVCSKDDIRYTLNQNHLCEIPLVKGKNTREHEKFKMIIRSKAFIETMRTLKNRTMNIIEEKGFKVIGFISTEENEGKTSVAAGYAKVISGTDEKVLFLTFDNNKDFSNKTGTNVKRQKLTTIDVIDSMAYEKPSGVLPGIKRIFTNVDLLIVNRQVINDKEKLENIFSELKKEYDYIVVDVIPGESHSEAVTLTDHCDAYISVIRCDYVSTNKIKANLDYFSYSSALNLGAILNEVSSIYISYGRYNGYGKYSKYGYYYDYNKYGYGNYGAKIPQDKE